MITLEHQGTPIPQGRIRHTRYGTYYPPTSVAHRKELVEAFKADLAGYDTYTFPFEGEVEIDIFLAGPRVSSDLDNHAKQVLDALVETGVIKDDDCRTVVQLRVRRQLRVPKKNRYTMVRVCPWERDG